MDNKDTLVDKLLCTACLCVGRSLQHVTDEKLQKYYLDALNEIPLCNLPRVCPRICWECHALLKKSLAFKEQVKDSFRILQTYTSENLYECLLTEVSRQPRLSSVHNKPTYWEPYESEDLFVADTSLNKPAVWVTSEIESVPQEEKLDVQMVCVKNEVKTDWDAEDDIDISPSDMEDPVDFSDMVKLETNRESDKKKKKTKKEKKVKKQSNDTKKSKHKKPIFKHILTIELSYEEMLAEREKDALKESYLKAEFKCGTCLVGFNYKKAYSAHVANKHNKSLGEYSCPICQVVIASVDSFTAHYKRHMRRYECSLCQKRTMDVKVMQQHYYSMHEIALKEYKCNVCGKISNSIDMHRYHRESHRARVPCPDCDKSFRHRAGLMNHRLAVHEMQNVFPCGVCQKQFRWKASLKRHTEKHHNKGAPAGADAYCAPCAVSFASQCSLQRHLRNSLRHVTPDQLRFICDHCQRRFADKTKLRDHIEEKHLHRTFHCHICQKVSKNRVGLSQHIRNVHRGRANNKMCHHCGKGFPTRMQLESHVRTHTGERPFICELCPTTFSQQSNLYKHTRQVHLNIKSKRYPLCKKSKETAPEPPAQFPAAPYSDRFLM